MEIVGVRDRAKLESDLKAVVGVPLPFTQDRKPTQTLTACLCFVHQEDASTAYYGAASQDVNSNSSTAGQSTEAIINGLWHVEWLQYHANILLSWYS